jgi:hypothetical protein
MIDIIVSGHKQKDRIEDYARSIITHLMPRKRKGLIVIDILKKVKYEDSIFCGLCYGDRHTAEIELAKNTTEKLTLEEMMVNLAHELVHAKQFFRGELHPNLNRWKSLDYHNVAYSRQPWEKEAYKLEDQLFQQFWK